MKKNNQSGLAVVAILGVVLLIGVVGFAINRVGQNTNKNDTSSKSSQEIKWEDREENKYYKPYANDSRFRLGDGYTQIYTSKDYKYEYGFYPGFLTDPSYARDVFVSESGDKKEATFILDNSIVLGIYAFTSENADYAKCKNDKVISLLSENGGEITSKDIMVNRVPTRVYIATRPPSPAKVGYSSDEGITKLVFSIPYHNRCINVTYGGTTEFVNSDNAKPELGPITEFKFTD